MVHENNPWDTMLPQHLEFIEVGPRDGFQILPDFIATEDKIDLIDDLIRAGIKRMEVTSFVHPKAVPQLRDAAKVMESIDRRNCQCFAMTPNLKGAERALAAGADMFNLVLSASESHNRGNLNRSIQESLDGFLPVMELAAGAGMPVRGSLSTAFGCPFEGDVPLDQVLSIISRLVEIGCVEINLCDTTGVANPRQVARMAHLILSEFNTVNFVMHFHNTRGAGAANLLAAAQNGITSFEASFGGLGGCPFAPNAAGNISTEDMVHMVHEMNIETGIDLLALLDVVRRAEQLLKMEFPGQVIKAGQSCDLHPLPKRKSG